MVWPKVKGMFTIMESYRVRIWAESKQSCAALVAGGSGCGRMRR